MAEVVRKSLIPFLHKRSKKKIMLVGLMVVIVCATGVYAYEQMSPQSTASVVRLHTVKRGDVTETVSASGTVRASRRISISPTSGGEAITSIRVNIGDRVKAGQVLATLDDSDARIQLQHAQANLLAAKAQWAEATKGKTAAEIKALEAKVSQAKSALDAAQNGYATQKARNDFEKAKTNLQNAQKTFQAQKTLYEEGVISKHEFEEAQSSFKQAQIEYNNAQLQHNQTQGEANSSLEQARAAYESAVAEWNDAKSGPDTATVQSAQAALVKAEAEWQAQQKAVNDLTVKAPMDGVIVQINGNVGEVPSSPFIVMDNSDADNLEVLAKISESDIGKVKEGLSAIFTSISFDNKEFAGKVKLVYPEATTDSGVTTYDVLLSIENKDKLLKTGMSVNVNIKVGTHQNVLVVPTAALKSQNGKDGVYLVSKSKADQSAREGKSDVPYRFQPVTIGYFSSDMVEITSGLKEGDQVVLTLNQSSASSNQGQRNGMGGFPGFGGPGGMGGLGGGMRGRQ
jgi:HlyD family secretion protein